jgi:hypothetical protein
MERIVRDRTKQEKALAEDENLEWIAMRARDWVKKREEALQGRKTLSGRPRGRGNRPHASSPGPVRKGNVKCRAGYASPVIQWSGEQARSGTEA